MTVTHTLDGDILHTRQVIHLFGDSETLDFFYDLRQRTVRTRGPATETPPRPLDAATERWLRRYALPAVGLKDFLA